MLHSTVTALLEACNIDVGNVNAVATLRKRLTQSIMITQLLSKLVIFMVYRSSVTHKCFSSYLDNHTQKCLVNGLSLRMLQIQV